MITIENLENADKYRGKKLPTLSLPKGNIVNISVFPQSLFILLYVWVCAFVFECVKEGNLPYFDHIVVYLFNITSHHILSTDMSLNVWFKKMAS